MAYDKTSVPVSRTQEAIKRLIDTHGGFGTAFVSDTDPLTHTTEVGFHAKVMFDGKPYAIRIMATVRAAPKSRTQNQQQEFRKQEERRIWRVLFYHLKSVYEASDSGVMEFRELMLPYLVTAADKTIAELLLPRLDRVLTMDPERLLEAEHSR